MSSDAIVAASEPSRRKWEWHDYAKFGLGFGIIALEGWRPGPADQWIILACLALLLDPLAGRADAQRAIQRVRRTISDGEGDGVG